MKNIFSILKLAKPMYGLMGLIVLIVIVMAILQQINPIISKQIVDIITAQLSENAVIVDNAQEQIIFWIVLSFVVAFASTALNSISSRLGDHFAGLMRKFLTERFYQKVLTLPQSYFDSEISGKVVNQLNRGIFVIQSFLNTSTNFIFPTFLQSIFTVVVLAYYNLPVAIFVGSLFPIYLIISQISAKRWGKEEEKKNKLEDIGRGRIQEVISNIKVVKSFTNQQNEYNFIEDKQTGINKIYAGQSKTFHTFDFLRNLSLDIVLFAVNFIVFYGAFQSQITLGEVVLIIQLVFQARRPLFAMSFILTQIQNAEAGSKEYLEILNLEGKESFAEQSQEGSISSPEIEFRNVTFEYEHEQDVLHNVSFKLDKQQKIALVGHSGAGKSTIINLILKFYQPRSGDIYLNGQAYSELDHQYIRSNIALVFQDNELFSSTIRENVAYGQNATDEQIVSALKKANAWGFVSKMKSGIDTQIGERGLKLSGGQKQRIQIARAILKNAPILVLDEATSSLDSKSELLIQEALEELMKGKLVIIIAHRFSTIQDVDRIIVIKNGEIEDQGSPAELAQKPGTYSELLGYQVEGNKKLLKNYELTL